MADFLQGVNIGASIVERQQQLRAQAALQAIRERQLAAEAQMMTERASQYAAKAQMEQQQMLQQRAVLQAGNDLFNRKVKEGLSEDEALKATIAPMASIDPDLASKMALAHQRLTDPAERQRHDRAMENMRASEITEQSRHNKTVEETARGITKPEIISLDSHDGRPPIRMIRTGPNSFAQEKIPSGMTLTTNPDGTVTFTQGNQSPDALTKPNLSKVQESQAQSLATIDVANRLEPLLSSSTVGPKAFVESWVNDRILANAFPELANQKRATAEQLASNLRASAVKELRSDYNVTEAERKQILESIPQVNDPVDSPARAKQLIGNIRKMAAVRALVAAKRMDGQVPRSAALALDDETIADLENTGLITPKIAFEAYKSKRRK